MPRHNTESCELNFAKRKSISGNMHHILFFIGCLVNYCFTDDMDTTSRLGHLDSKLEKFGSHNPGDAIDAVDGFPLPKVFFDGYILPSKPLKMTGAAKLSPAFAKWTDDYFLNLVVPADNSMTVETKKKENRLQPTLDMNFKDFVRVYNQTDQYMVNPVPQFLSSDIVVPGPLQCEDLLRDAIMEAMMWFSSGGTKSVVHTDSVENINCLYSGRKEFVMVNPHVYGHLVDIDHPEGAYSGVDVDKVDFDKYPGLAHVKYQHVALEAGDCLYIPYKWIHQVRSYERNVAVNLWWDYTKNTAVDWESCALSFNPELTLDKITTKGLEGIDDEGDLRDYFLDMAKQEGQVSFEDLTHFLIPDMDSILQMNPGDGYKMPIRRMFRIMDLDEDGGISVEEASSLSEGSWLELQAEVSNLEVILDHVAQLWEEQEHTGRDEL